ncbi:MAG TPA: hypothetical protein VEI97_00370, partial [bacterium]|nr:hypothetical protein [bacterium]
PQILSRALLATPRRPEDWQAVFGESADLPPTVSLELNDLSLRWLTGALLADRLVAIYPEPISGEFHLAWTTDPW